MTKSLLDMVSETNFTVFVNSARELHARLEAGAQVEYRYKGAYIISQKRGQEYVTVSAPSEEEAQAKWKEIHETGYHYDFENGRRVTIPGAR